MSAYPLRVSRRDAIAIVNRGGDYVVHAGRREVVWSQPPQTYSAVRTACGRLMHLTNEHDADVSCRRCRAVLDRL